MKIKNLILFTCCVISILLQSCVNKKSYTIEREELFNFRIGRLEDELDLFNLEGKRNQRRTALKMRDGLFYISNGNGEKITRHNSYGDLLFMIYNEETNPPPLTLRTKTDNSSVTRWAYSWPLREPGYIAVNSLKHIFVEDKLPPERHNYDRENKVLLDSMVIHFDAEGSFVEYLGQEGRGGTPFPRIEGVYTSVNDEIVVVCHLPKERKVYWFDSNGNLLYQIQFDNNALLKPNGRYGLLPSLDTLTIAPDKRAIYLKIDYYREITDESTNTIAGREPDSSYIWTVNAEDGKWVGSTFIPFYESVSLVNNRKITDMLLYSMFGALKGGRIFFYFPTEEGFAILILSTDGSGSQLRGMINVDVDELQFCTFDISEDGILSALLSDNYSARLVWWRTDKLIQ